MTRYIDPKTDFGFKRLFGQEDSKDILKQFLFDVLELPYPIQEISYIPNEQLPTLPDERIGVYDVYCVDAVGQRFIVEMQRGWQLFIKDRVLFYSVFPLLHQARKGGQWRFELLPLYCIAIVNFTIEPEAEEDKQAEYLRRVQLLDTKTCEVFYDKLTFVFIELPKFHRSAEQLEGEIDKWTYLLKYMPELQDIPAELKSEPFTHAFDLAREAALSEEERWEYEMSLKRARDAYATLEGAHYRGRAAGMEEGRRRCSEEIARYMLARGLDPAMVAELTSLPLTVIESLTTIVERKGVNNVRNRHPNCNRNHCFG